MLRLELLQQINLLLLITSRQAHLLLPLIKHHLLHHAPRLAIQIRQGRILRHDLGDVDLGRRGDDMRPPLHLVGLVEVDLHDLRPVRAGSHRPGAVVDADRVGERAGDDRGLVLDARGEGGLGQQDGEVTRFEGAGDGEGEVDIGDGLGPFVGEGGLLGCFGVDFGLGADCCWGLGF